MSPTSGRSLQSPQERARAMAAQLIRSAARVDLNTDLDDELAAELRALADLLSPPPPGQCRLLQWPNDWGCHEPRCGDSTWDHDCPTPPCTDPAHGHRSPAISRMARDLAVGLLHSHPDVSDPMGALAAELRSVADQMQYRPHELAREFERHGKPSPAAPRPITEVMDEVAAAVAARAKLRLLVYPDAVVFAAALAANRGVAVDVEIVPDPAVPLDQAILDCPDCPDRGSERAPASGRGPGLWYVKHSHRIGDAAEEAVHTHPTAQHHPGNWSNPLHEGVDTIAWAELRLQLAADLAAEEAPA